MSESGSAGCLAATPQFFVSSDLSTVNCFLPGLQMSMYSKSKRELTYSSVFSPKVRCHQDRTFILSVPVDNFAADYIIK